MAKQRSPKTQKRLFFAVACGLGSWLFMDLAMRPVATKVLSSVEGGFTDLRHKLWWFLKRPGPEDPGSPVAVVDIDERTLSKLGFYGENYRRHHAKVLERLSTLGAGVLTFDVFFKSGDSGKAQAGEFEATLSRLGMDIGGDSLTQRRIRKAFDHTQALAEAVAASPSCVLAAQLEDNLKYANPSDWIPRARRNWQSSISMGLALPPDQLAAMPGNNVLDGIFPGMVGPNTTVGLVNVACDPDGRYRRLALLRRFPDTSFVEPALAPEGSAVPRAYPVIALQAALKLLGRRPEEIRYRPGQSMDLGVPLRIWKDGTGLHTSAPGLTGAMVEDLMAARRSVDSLLAARKGVASYTRTVSVERRPDGSFVTRLAYPDTLDDAATRALLANAGDTAWLGQIPSNSPAALSDRVLVQTSPDGSLTLASFDAPGGKELSRVTVSRRDRDILLLGLLAELPQGLESLAPGRRANLSNWIEVWWDRVRGRATTSLLALRGSSLTDLLRLSPQRLASLRQGDTIGLGEPIRIPVDAAGNMLLHFQAPENTDGKAANQSWIRHVSFVDVLEGKLDEALVPGRAFVIGSSATALFDFVPIPLQDRYPGVSLQATALQDIVSGDYLHEMRRWQTSLVLLAMALLAALLTAVLSPVWALAGTALLLLGWFAASLWAFDAGIWTEIQLPFLSGVVAFLAMLTVRWFLEEKEKRFLNAAFKTYLSPEVIDDMAERGELPVLGGREYQVTPFFTDIQGFSSFSELLPPEQLVSLLNEYLGAMTDILLANQGTFDKYIGDAIVTFWGAPQERPDHAACAMRTALQMQKKLAQLRAKWVTEGERWPTLVHGMRMRIGLNTGAAVIGNMGTHNRMQYTMMGDTVNLAARLESGSKHYGVYVLAAEETVRQGGEEFLTRELDLVRVVGKSEPVAVSEVLCLRQEASPERLSLVGSWSRARKLYLQGDFAAALSAFRECQAMEPWYGQAGVKTSPSLVFAARCEHFLENPPSAWDGIWTATEK